MKVTLLVLTASTAIACGKIDENKDNASSDNNTPINITANINDVSEIDQDRVKELFDSVGKVRKVTLTDRSTLSEKESGYDGPAYLNLASDNWYAALEYSSKIGLGTTFVVEEFAQVEMIEEKIEDMNKDSTAPAGNFSRQNSIIEMDEMKVGSSWIVRKSFSEVIVKYGLTITEIKGDTVSLKYKVLKVNQIFEPRI